MEATEELRDVLLAAFRDAEQRRHEYVTLEHVLLAISTDARASKTLKALAIDIPTLQQDLEVFFAESIDALPQNKRREVKQTPTFQRVLERATEQMHAAGRDRVDTGSLLVSFYREPASHAVYLLEKQGVTRIDVLNYVSHGVAKVGRPAEGAGAARHRRGRRRRQQVARARSRRFCTDLTQRAREGKIDPLIGRAERARAHDPGAVPPPQEQPDLRRRPRRRQDRASSRAWRCASSRARCPAVLEDAKIYVARHGRAGRRHASYRGDFEYAPQGRDPSC